MIQYDVIVMLKEAVRPIGIQGERPDLLLVNVPATFEQGIIPDDEEPPFGLLRVAVAAETTGQNVALLDAHRHKLSINEINNVLCELKPMSVGINPTSVNVAEAQEIAEMCAIKDIPLILGGVHATLDPSEVLKTDFPMSAVAVKGKGESVISRILDSFKYGHQVEANGVYYQGSDKMRQDFADYYPLDKLPLIEQNRWVVNPINNKKIKTNDGEINLREISLYETAGCPFECTFCATPALVGRGNGHKTYYRPSMDRILESTRLATELGANAVHFVDDMAFVLPKNFHEFSEGVEQLNLGYQLHWRGMTRAPIIADKCSDKDLEVLKNSGCWRLAIGVESGNQNMLKQTKKGITLDQARRAVLRLRKAGIPQVKAFFIMGFPGETVQQMEDTKTFIMELRDLGLTDISLFQFKPYPGTEEWARLERTNPSVLQQLSYIRRDGVHEGGVSGKKVAEGVWLQDDLQIAEVNSGYVRELVINTIQTFYGN